MKPDKLELLRYYADTEYRESLPCRECGKRGGCKHFPAETKRGARRA